jgi:hypothetical protein
METESCAGRQRKLEVWGVWKRLITSQVTWQNELAESGHQQIAVKAQGRHLFLLNATSFILGAWARQGWKGEVVREFGVLIRVVS